MKRLLLIVLALNTSAVNAQTLLDVSAFSQQQIFENWVQNRCIGKIADSKILKYDAEASAAAWLEASDLPAENFEKGDKAIASLLKETVGGTEPGNYQVLKCSLIANSNAIRLLGTQK
ncbi:MULTISPECIES: T6SS amidase immunity protein Tai4 family protein [unclassified Enterobacter]|uniref:T6SS amidase immunity protein Tai4 family protein n=1 Tax=unclassified Enterobacter TaxID=2608935 RepID=UPI002147DB7F|nr:MULTISPECIES: T6SS amidase immunity protein Tai4 family protein [unclassified Enterobacter]MCR1300489.1 T6SS amidase immunity protein Tai4 family protein [Enterobacter sp. FL1277]MCR1308424.1 T6SS amidase immunity protein Tai4 family protein [Enterobacter sp. BT1271]MCR1311485.1 T6SS amidase immunity protein Tai4 family protein [Enterobacter sp. BT855]MCR1322873.1 T6SS amidase immunity protein Tai4 family protein [Enterobacter sp. BT1268]MCR1327298.1 T6SS amidase immunity protein Tai4 famil